MFFYSLFYLTNVTHGVQTQVWIGVGYDIDVYYVIAMLPLKIRMRDGVIGIKEGSHYSAYCGIPLQESILKCLG